MKKRRPVAILGATGMVGRRLAELLVDHPQFELALLVGSGASEQQSFESVWTAKEEAARQHYGEFWKPAPYPSAGLGEQRRVVESFDTLLARREIEVVFSSVPERAGALEGELVRSGRMVFSNSPYARFDDSVPVIVPEVNADVLLGGGELRSSRLVKNPNCVTSGLVIVLKALADRYGGIDHAAATTYQSLSGRGDAKYDPDLVVNNVYPLHGSEENTEKYIRAEVNKVLGRGRDHLPISVACYRVPTQEGHLVDVRVKTKERPPSREDVVDLFASFAPLASLNLHSAPKTPIVFVAAAGRPRPRQDAWHEGGMSIAVGSLSTDDDVYDVRLTFVVNNLVRGAAGGALLNAELWNRVHT